MQYTHMLESHIFMSKILGNLLRVLYQNSKLPSSNITNDISTETVLLKWCSFDSRGQKQT